MKTQDAILHTIAIVLIASLIRIRWFGWDVSLYHFVVFFTAIWAAVDSSTIQLKRYKSGISYSPVVLFFCFLLLWVVAFPWYLAVRYKIKTGKAMLKDGAAYVAA